MSVEQRFWDKVQKSDGCWTWTGCCRGLGYGGLHFLREDGRRTTIRAHRLSWNLHYGAIPDGLWVLHKCDNPPCVRPDHLFLGDRVDNMRDCARKGRICNVGYGRKTHCKNGHKYTQENTYVRKEGHRVCRICRATQKRSAWHLKKAQSIRAMQAEEKGQSHA